MMVRKLRNAGKMEACGWHTQIGVPNKTPCESLVSIVFALKSFKHFSSRTGT